MHGYRDVIAIREVWTTLLLSALIRIPIFSLGIVMSVHVVSSLHLDYVRAGAVTTVVTVATMISGPWRGSMVDRKGLRRTMLPSLIITTITWGLSPWLGYFPLLALCAIGGLWNYPIFTIPRQVLMVAVPTSRRRAALSLDSVTVEICYMIGPTVAIIAATTIGTQITITACGFIAAIGAAGLMILNPATTEPSEADPVPPAARTPASAAPVVQAPHNRKMAWLSPRSASILLAVIATGFCLGGIELTTVAAMRSMGHPEMIGWVLAASGFGSAIGGVLYGALPRSSGSVTLDGREVVTRSPQDGLANGIVYISEDRKRDGLVLGMSVKENMSLTALRYFSRAGGSLKHKDEQQAVSDFIRLFNVKTPSMEQAIGLLSGGNQQKVAIARGLMTRPKVLILDEPTRGVDVGAKKEIYQLINQFKADGLSIILVSSEMPEVLGMSDRIIVMHEGHLGGEFTREQATQEVLMAAAVGKLNRVNQE